MWYLTGDTQDMNTMFDTQEEALKYIKSEGFEVMDGDHPNEFVWFNFDDEMMVVTLTERAF